MFSTKPRMSVLYSRTSVLCFRTSVLSSRTDSRCLSQPRSNVITIYVPSFIYVIDLPYETGALLSLLPRLTHTGTTAHSRTPLALASTAHCPAMHQLHAHKIISNPWLLPMPYHCALFHGTLLLMTNTGWMATQTLDGNNWTLQPTIQLSLICILHETIIFLRKYLI